MTSPLIILKYRKLLKLAGLYIAMLSFCVVGESIKEFVPHRLKGDIYRPPSLDRMTHSAQALPSSRCWMSQA
jgi:hypothetical protein